MSRTLSFSDIPIASDLTDYIQGPHRTEHVPDPDKQIHLAPPTYHDLAAARILQAPAIISTAEGADRGARYDNMVGRIRSAKRPTLADLVETRADRVQKIHHAARMARALPTSAHPVITLALSNQLGDLRAAEERGDTLAADDARSRLLLTTGVAAGIDMLMGVDDVAAAVRAAPAQMLAGEGRVISNIARAGLRRPLAGLALLAAGTLASSD